MPPRSDEALVSPGLSFPSPLLSFPASLLPCLMLQVRARHPLFTAQISLSPWSYSFKTHPSACYAPGIVRKRTAPPDLSPVCPAASLQVQDSRGLSSWHPVAPAAPPLWKFPHLSFFACWCCSFPRACHKSPVSTWPAPCLPSRKSRSACWLAQQPVRAGAAPMSFSADSHIGLGSGPCPAGSGSRDRTAGSQNWLLMPQPSKSRHRP